MEDLKELIIEQIKNNRLDTLNYDLVINQLEVLNNKSYDVIKSNLDSLINSGKVQLKGMATEKKWQPKPKQNKPKYDRSGNAPKSPYGSYKNYGNANVDLAYDILAKKDKKTASKVKRLEGKIQSTSRGYAFLIPDDITQEDVFIAERDLGGAMHNDRVVVSVKPSSGRRMEGKVLQILERGFEKVVYRN